jgi:hypothetical protein
LSTAAAKLWRLFNFHLLFYLDMAEAPSSTFNPRLLLQLQSSSPLQIQSSLPTLSLIAANLIAFQFLNPVDVLFPPVLLDDARGVLDATAAR